MTLSVTQHPQNPLYSTYKSLFPSLELEIYVHQSALHYNYSKRNYVILNASLCNLV
jgi:hypothetical protein